MFPRSDRPGLRLPASPHRRKRCSRRSCKAGRRYRATPASPWIFPAGLFPVDAGPTEKGKGQKFRSADGAYEFAAYTLANAEKDSPARYLRKNLIVPPQSLIYRRVTEQFFVMSSIRDGRIFYSRCNFSLGIHCIFLEYPTAEKRAFDPVVTRVSTSLRPR